MRGGSRRCFDTDIWGYGGEDDVLGRCYAVLGWCQGVWGQGEALRLDVVRYARHPFKR